MGLENYLSASPLADKRSVQSLSWLNRDPKRKGSGALARRLGDLKVLTAGLITLPVVYLSSLTHTYG